MRFFLLFFFIFLNGILNGQDTRLANQYYNTGEYEKAAQMYKNLYDKSNANSYYFNRYINCLVSLEEYEAGEKVIKKQMKKQPEAIHLYVTLGNLYEQLQKPELADQTYSSAIQKIKGNPSDITSLGNAFIGVAKYDYAIKVFEKGTKLAEKGISYAYHLGDLYRRKGNKQKMVEYYLKSIAEKPQRRGTIQSIFQRNLEKEDMDELVSQLFLRAQENPDIIQYNEMLEWAYIQRKDFKRALRQARALDKRLQENGSRVFNMGRIASNARDYNTAISAFEYIIQEKGNSSSYFPEAKKELLANKRKLITYTTDYDKEDLLDLEREYVAYIKDVGLNTRSAFLAIELAKLRAEYLDNLPEAIQLLDSLISFRGMNRYISANAKLDLGDYYLMSGDRWEATLLYSQVDKEFREDYLGEKARFKNALLSYYGGDFEWSQAQFDILKASTSKLISNDAIDRSVFIMDNTGTDSIMEPVEMYAATELLIFQNKYDEAFEKLDSIRLLYGSHALNDDILYLKANLYTQLENYDAAIKSYNEVITLHSDEIRCDNSLYELAMLYEEKLKQPEKAKELYERLFIDYSNSTYAVDARKKYRVLRGDQNIEDNFLHGIK